MSFSATTEQIRNRTKTVTRRLGWSNIKAGDLVQAVEKAQGLKRGERVVRLATLRIVSNTRVCLRDIDESDLVYEGFPRSTPLGFVKMFCELNGCDWNREVNRIEFEYVD